MRHYRPEIPISPQHVPPEVLRWAVQQGSGANSPIFPLDEYLESVSRKIAQLPPAGIRSTQTTTDEVRETGRYIGRSPQPRSPKWGDQREESKEEQWGELRSGDRTPLYDPEVPILSQPERQFYNPNYPQSPATKNAKEIPSEHFYVKPESYIVSVPGQMDYQAPYVQSVPSRIVNAEGIVPCYASLICSPILEEDTFLSAVAEDLHRPLLLTRTKLLAEASTVEDHPAHRIWQRLAFLKTKSNFAEEQAMEEQLIFESIKYAISRSTARHLILYNVPASKSEARFLIEGLGIPVATIVCTMHPRLALRRASRVLDDLSQFCEKGKSNIL